MLRDFGNRLLKGFAGLLFLLLILFLSPVVTLLVIAEGGVGVEDRFVQFVTVALISSIFAAVIMFLFYYLIDRVYFQKMSEALRRIYATVVLNWVVLFGQVFYVAYTLCFLILVFQLFSLLGKNASYVAIGALALVFVGYHFALNKFGAFEERVRQKYGVSAKDMC